MITKSSDKLGIYKLCKIVEKHRLYADWGIMLEMSQRPDDVRFVAIVYKNHVPAGTIMVYWRHRKMQIGTFVKNDFRRQGIGTELYNSVPKEYKEMCKIQYPFSGQKVGQVVHGRAKKFYDSVGKIA